MASIMGEKLNEILADPIAEKELMNNILKGQREFTVTVNGNVYTIKRIKNNPAEAGSRIRRG
jgi:hypothetical protein